jgi:hypothetical protein
MITLTALALFLITLTQGTGDQAKGWKGIVPLHSTRADVERLIGPPSPPPSDRMRLYTPNTNMPLYFLEDKEARIGYMTDANAKRLGCYAVPVDTVLYISVDLKKHPSLRDLGIDESRFETFDPSDPPNIGFKAYVDTVEGMYICTQDSKINRIGYYGNANDRQVCPALDKDAKQFCHVLVDLLDNPPKPGRPKGD